MHCAYQYCSYTNAFRPESQDYIRFTYNCAQLKCRQRAIRKKDGVTPRDKASIATFDCDGWLHVTIWESTHTVLVKLKHAKDHVPYWSIDVPVQVQDYVRNNPELKPHQLWDWVLKEYGRPTYDRKAIYRLWHEQDQKLWKRHADEKLSAQILLDEASLVNFSATGRTLFSTETIPLPSFDGVDALAFCLPDVLRQWGTQIRELAIDSSWNTNGSRYEIYGVLGEVYGSGCPIAYLLIRVNASQDTGTKELYIRAVLRHLRDAWHMRVLVTLTDKDWSEINACHARALKKRLPIKDRAPAFYDAEEAHREFDFIKTDFVPIGQIHTGGRVAEVSSEF
ncbi:hypothetical protein HDZ31DRAFT_47670 [Schizophyllum fasciatum]